MRTCSLSWFHESDLITSVELQAFKANVSEADAKLKKLGEKMSEIEVQKQENEAAIAHAEQIIRIQTESTSSEVVRLKGTFA